MDRFGPSEDCEVCGQPLSYGHSVMCPVCEKTMCNWCVNHNHDCYDVYTEESANEAYTREKEEQEQ